MTKVFISYSRKDKSCAEKVRDALGTINIEAWIDWVDIDPAADWRAKIKAGIEQADAFLFLLSPDSVVSKVCQEETELAILNGKRLIPLLVREVESVKVHPALGRLNWIFFREEDPVPVSLSKLEEAIKTDLEWVELHSRLQVRAVEWQEGGERSRLLRGKDLEEAENALANAGQKDPPPTDLQRSFLLESRRLETRNRNRVIVVAAIVALMLVGLSIYAFRQEAAAAAERDRAQRSLSRFLAKQSTDLLEAGSLDQALLLSVDAYETMPTFEAVNSLRLGLEDSPQLNKILRMKESLGDRIGRNILFRSDGSLWVPYIWTPTVYSWNMRTFAGEIAQQPLVPQAYDMLLSPDGKTLAVAQSGGLAGIYLFDTTTGRQLGDAIAMNPGINFNPILTFSPTGREIAASQADHTLQIWNVADHLPGPRIDGLPDRGYLPIAFSQDGKRLALPDTDDNIVIRDATDGSAIGEPIPTADLGWISALAFSPTQDVLVIGGEQIGIWDIPNSRMIETLPIENTGRHLTYLLFRPDGRFLAVARGNEGIWLWDMFDRQLTSLMINKWLVPAGPLAFSNDGNTLAAMDTNGNVMLFDVQPVHAIHRLLLQEVVTSLAFHEGGSQLLARKEDGSQLAWNTSTGLGVSAPVDALIKEEAVPALTSTCLTPTRIGCDEHQILLADRTLGSGSGEVSEMALSPDQKTVAVGTASGFNDQGGITIIDVDSGKQRALPNSGTQTITSLAFSPDGRRLAAGNSVGIVTLYDLSTNASRQADRLIGDQRQSALKLAFSTDGKMLASASEDQILLWDATTMTALVELPGKFIGDTFDFSPDLLQGPPMLVLSDDHHWLAVQDATGVSLWNLDTKMWKGRACEIAARNFTEEEWAKYYGNEAYQEICPVQP